MESIQLARLIISQFEHTQGDVVTNLKLQKLMYYAHGWSLGLSGIPLLTDDNIQAWTYGPVVKPVYHHYKDYYGSQAIIDELAVGMKADASELIKLVVEHYG